MPNYNGHWGKTLAEAKRKDAAARKARSKADKAEVRKRMAKVTKIEADGRFVHVEFTRNDGQRVSATYELWAWDQPPADVAATDLEAIAQASVPLAVWRGSKESGRPPREQAKSRQPA